MKNAVVRVVVASLLVLASTAPAVADGDSYAEQIIAADAVSLGVTLGGDAMDHNSLRDVGLGLSVSAAPLVHIANGNRMGAAKSLALHVTLPLATSVVVDQLTEDKTTSMLAFATSMVVATAIDASTLAKKKLLDLRWRPDIGFRDGGVQLRIVARF